MGGSIFLPPRWDSPGFNSPQFEGIINQAELNRFIFSVKRLWLLMLV
jgi:hypothetical protein